jgi:hypothetical protein
MSKDRKRRGTATPSAAPPRPTDCGEYLAAHAMELLDELGLRLFECRAVVDALASQLDLNFDEFLGALGTVEWLARQAFQAASLLHQGAQLEAARGRTPSRPKVIFARHNAAVARGAARIEPLRSSVEEMSLALWVLASFDSPADASGARPICAPTNRTTGRPCTTPAIYIGNGQFGPHCYTHSTPDQRDQFRRNQERLCESGGADETHAAAMDAIAHDVAADWLNRRATAGSLP